MCPRDRVVGSVGTYLGIHTLYLEDFSEGIIHGDLHDVLTFIYMYCVEVIKAREEGWGILGIGWDLGRILSLYTRGVDHRGSYNY